MSVPKMRSSRLLWLFPVIWIAHGIEEWNTHDWYQRYWVGAEDLDAVTVRTWLVLVSLSGLLCTLVASRLRLEWFARLTVVFFVSQAFANTLQHLYWWRLLDTYSPGIFSALLLVVPVFSWLAFRTVKQGLMPAWLLALALSVALPTMWVTVTMANQMPDDGLPIYRFSRALASALGLS